MDKLRHTGCDRQMPSRSQPQLPATPPPRAKGRRQPAAPPSRNVLPIGLLAEGRPCLVVGGGKVAERKVGVLLEGAAQVQVVSPALTDPLRALALAGNIQHVKRRFKPDDVKGCLVVFAATNDKTVNRKTLDACRRHGVLCCPVDGNWTLGDFVTPAVLRHGDLTVAISTGGRSCRKSRTIRENLARHIDEIETCELVVLGTSHACLPLKQRAPFHLTGDRTHQIGAMLSKVWGIHEFILLNTCNRVEFLGAVSVPNAVMPLINRILRFDTLPSNAYYLHRSREAFRHLATLTAGLLSQTPGESHIVGQVKAAAEEATRREWAGPLMQEWIASTLHISKRIRRQTESLLRVCEVEDICAAFLQPELTTGVSKTVVVIGSGVVGRGLVDRLLPHVAHLNWIYHTRRPPLPKDEGHRLKLGTFRQLRNSLSEADIVIAATASPAYIVRAEDMSLLDRDKPVLMVDLAIPRNIAPEIDALTPNVRVVDLDNLQTEAAIRPADLERAHRIGYKVIKAHTELYEHLVDSLQNGSARQ